MAGQEARINDALKQLGEEYRLGMVQVAEYRSRRKQLVDGWGERDVTTSPRKSKSTTATGAPPTSTPTQRRPAIAPSPPKQSPVPFIIAGIALVALAGAGWYLFKGKPAPTVATPAAAPISAAADAMRSAADQFIVRNAWDAGSVNALTAQWSGLSASDKARLADEPAMRTLRFKLDQNIQAEMQLVTPESSPEERAQLTLLQDFSRVLAGKSQ